MNRYDKALIFVMENTNYSFNEKYSNKNSILLSYFDYAECLEIKDEDLNKRENKEKFIIDTLYTDKEANNKDAALDQIIKSQHEDKVKKAYIEFLYSDIDLKELPIDKKTIEKYEKIIRDNRDEKKEKEILDSLNKEEIILSLLKVKIKNTQTKVHIDYFNKNSMTMFYINNTVFLNVGINLTFNNLSNLEEVPLADILKSVGDPTRFSIVKGLIEKDMTSTEISKLVNVSLSTVNHHINQLISFNIVNVAINSKDSRGGLFSLNKKYLQEICDFIKVKLG